MGEAVFLGRYNGQLRAIGIELWFFLLEAKIFEILRSLSSV